MTTTTDNRQHLTARNIVLLVVVLLTAIALFNGTRTDVLYTLSGAVVWVPMSLVVALLLRHWRGWHLVRTVLAATVIGLVVSSIGYVATVLNSSSYY